VSSSDHPLPEIQIEPPVQSTSATPVVAINPGAENPPWSGFDLLIVALVLVACLFLFTSIFFFIVLHSSLSRGVSAAELGKNPGPLVIVPSMTLAYVAMLIAMYRVVVHRQRPFWQTVGWRWPANLGWLGFMSGGALLAVGLGELSRLLPIPKSLPMDQFFQNRQGAYLMMIFGVAIAPLAEEMLFRGFLYPVLDRWLQTLFMTPWQVRRGCIWILIMAAWGYIENGLPRAWSLLLAVAAFLAIGVPVVLRSLKSGQKPPAMVLLPASTTVAWGLASGAISHHAFGIVTASLLIAACLLGLFSIAPALEFSVAGRWGRILAVLATSFAFAMVHSEQLGQAWGPLLVLFVVGLVLTITRVVTRSVTPGLLIHVGYNLMLFGVLYVGTDHFRHLERMTQ
jgi:membrane protease YdiL (CAAX protease family)